MGIFDKLFGGGGGGGNDGSLGVQDPSYEQYAMMHSDLMSDYQQNWAPRGVTLSEYGAMHYHEHGKNEGRAFPGQGGSSGGGGGGGGSSSQNAMLAEMRRQEEAARQAEARRQQQMQQNFGSINSMFDQRAAGYDQYADDLYAHNKTMFDEDSDTARNQANFALARSGQLGGSVDADTNADLERMYQDGLTNLKSGSRDAANSLKARDNQQRNSLLQMAGSGNYSSYMLPGSSVGNDTSLTTLGSGLGNRFSSLLSGIGGASRNRNPWGF